MDGLSPKVPEMLHPLAREVLEDLRGRPEAGHIVIGGGVALQHYLPYRQTADLDAWWSKDTLQATAEKTPVAIQEVMEKTAARHGLETENRPYIDGSVYPDQDPPVNFKDDYDRADYLDRTDPCEHLI